MDFKLTSGQVVSSFTPWSPDTCPSKTQRRLTCTKRSWLQSTRCPSFSLPSAKTSFKRSSTPILRLESASPTFGITHTCVEPKKMLYQSKKKLACSLGSKKCLTVVIFLPDSSMTSSLKRSTQSDASKRTVTTTSQRPTIWSTRRIKETLTCEKLSPLVPQKPPNSQASVRGFSHRAPQRSQLSHLRMWNLRRAKLFRTRWTKLWRYQVKVRSLWA